MQHKSISLVKSLSGGLGPKREDRPAAFAGRSESVFWIFCWWDTARAYTGEYPIPTRAPSTPQADHTGKESENAPGEKADTFGENSVTRYSGLETTARAPNQDLLSPDYRTLE